MPHPFFNRALTKYPRHRREARALHSALYSVFSKTAQIEQVYRACARDNGELPPLVEGSADHVWADALDKLTFHTGALRRLCELHRESPNDRLREAIRGVIEAKAEHLSEDHIKALTEAFTKAGKIYDGDMRRALLAKLPEAYTRDLPEKADAGEQLTSDLERLNTTEQFGEQVPLKVWLQNAGDRFAGLDEAEIFRQAHDELTAQPAQRADVEKLTEVIEKVWQKIQKDDAARDAVAHYKRTFRRSREKIDVITDLKGLHEEIHTLQVAWPDSIDDDVSRFPSDPRAKLKVSQNYAGFLTTTMKSMSKIVGKGNIKPGDLQGWCRGSGGDGSRPADRNWFEAMIRLQGEFVEAVNRIDKGRIREIFGEIVGCLSPTLSGLNTQLKKGVEQLNLNELISAMGDVCNVLIKLYPQRTAEKVSLYQSGINELKALDERLRELKDQHDRWQGADTKLKMFNTLLSPYLTGGAGAEQVLDLFLKALPTDFEPLYKESAATWAGDLRTATEEIRAALAAKDSNMAAQWFHNYKGHVAFRFYELDDEMKAQCDELGKVGDELRKVDDELEKM